LAPLADEAVFEYPFAPFLFLKTAIIVLNQSAIFFP
jgi:hypothetical protein